MTTGNKGTPTQTGLARRRSKAEHEHRVSAPLADPRPLLTVDDTARYLAVSRWTVYRLIHEGELKAVKVGKTTKVRPSAIDDYLDRSPAA